MVKISLMAKIVPIILIFSVGHAEEISFTGYAFDTQNGNVSVINGSFTQDTIKKQEKISSDYRKMNDEVEASIKETRRQIEAANQLFELQKQTELLEKIFQK
jgi:hypothetical protein